MASGESLVKQEDEARAPSDHELTPESRLPMLSAGVRHRLLKGDMDNLPAVQSRVVRIYVSSNFHGIISYTFNPFI